MSKRLIQKNATKERIMKAAYQVYAERGFTATTNDIAKAARVSHGTIFAHFPTLDDLLSCLLLHFGNTVSVRMHELAEGKEGIAEVLHAHINVLEEYEDFYCRMITQSSMLPTDMKNIVIAFQSNVSFHFTKAFELEIMKGTVRNIPLHMVFNTWLGLVHYYLQNRELFAPGASVLKQRKTELVGAFLRLTQNEKEEEK